MAWMSKTSVPEIEGVGGNMGFGYVGAPDVLERARAVTSEDHGPTGKGLHGKTSGIKFERAFHDSKILCVS